MKRLHTSLLLAGAAALALAGMFAACRPQGRGASDESSYVNLDTGVHYMGRESCQPCHKEIYESYVETGMGRSLYRPDPHDVIEDFGPDAVVHDPVGGFSYRPYWQGGEMFILEFRLQGEDTLYRRAERMDYVIGSGHQTRSYLLDRGGYLYEAPITWYVARRRWDLSPGYENGRNSRFDREVGEECMVCHTGKLSFGQGTTNFFQSISLGIDCEKCHGPGEEHIARMERDEIVDVGEHIDYSIVNPAKLPLDLQIDVCQQCHLQGVTVLKGGRASVQDYRPGMDLGSVYDIFIPQFSGDAGFGIASHGERMMQSKCFIGSAGKLTCITCHDPHQSIAVTGAETYDKQCQNCHRDASSMAVCSSPSTGPGCTGCHMRKAGVTDIPHVTFTDHKIRVLGAADSIPADAGKLRTFMRLVAMTDSNPGPSATGRAYLKYYDTQEREPAALAEAASLLPADDHASRAQLASFQGRFEEALRHVDAALKGRPGDNFLRFQRADLLEKLGRLGPAKEAFGALYAADARLTEAGIRQASLILSTATTREPALSDARAILERCLARKPFDPKLRANLGFVEMNAQRFPQAEEHLQAALATHPDYVLALQNMVLLQRMKGAGAQAAAYLARLAAIDAEAAARLGAQP